VSSPTEDTITTILANELEKRSVKVQTFPKIELPGIGIRKPDIWCHNGGDYVIEAKTNSSTHFNFKLRPAMKRKTEKSFSRGGYLWDRNRSEKGSSTASMTCIMARDSKGLSKTCQYHVRRNMYFLFKDLFLRMV